MNKKITRRAVLGVAVAAIAVGPFAVRHLCDKNRVDIAFEEGRDVESLFTSAILPETPDISSFEREFEAIITHAPLALAQSAVRRFRYKTTSSGVMQFADHGILDNHRNKVKMPSQTLYREVSYISPGEMSISERKDVVIYDQKVSLEGTPRSAEMEILFNTRFKVTFDGLILEPVQKEESLRQVSPMYLSTPVGNGSTWNQTLLADSRLNPGGLVEAKLGILATYIRGGERFMRISSDLGCWVYQPAVESNTGSIISGVYTENTVRLRSITVLDFNIDKGIDTFSRGIQMMYAEKSPHANGEDMFSITFTETTLT